jgi:hypothetical protein
MRMKARRLSVTFALTAVTAAMLSLNWSPARADGGEPFNGTFTAVAVRAPQCTSPVGFCTHGTLYDTTGRHVADYDFTMLTNTPTGDGTHFRYTGASLITKTAGAPGTMMGQDEGTIEFKALEPSPFVTTVHVVEGTGAYTRAHGVIVAEGNLDLVTGDTVGGYSGTIERS